MSLSLTHSQRRAIDITQKTISSVSVVGEFLVIGTFLASNKFRKPVNRLVFYATWGNIFTNMATLIGQSGIRIGINSPLCQFQGFLIQWLMPADALWIFAMAINVWLSFFHHWDASKLKTLEWKYVLFCYGTPLITAIVLLCINSKTKGRVYGDAVLWCWTSLDWDFLRIAVFYGPVWVIILLTFAIYLRVGAVIWKWRRHANSAGASPKKTSKRGRGDIENAGNEIRRVDEVTVTREEGADDQPDRRSQGSTPTLRPHNIRNRAFAVFSKRRSSGKRLTFARTKTNRATIRYFKCALMFFLALIVVWVPSTVNRVWTLVRPTDVIFGLQYAAGLVLPLQGTCNSVIYFATSIYACECLWRDILERCGLRKPEPQEKPVPTRDWLGDTNMSSRADISRVDSDLETIAESENHSVAESETGTIAASDHESLKSVGHETDQ